MNTMIGSGSKLLRIKVDRQPSVYKHAVDSIVSCITYV